MITLADLCRAVEGLQMGELQHWIRNQWVRPQGTPDAWRFEEIDIARVRLIVELRHDLDLDEEAMPVVLSLLDQLYDTRRRMLGLRAAVEQVVPADARPALLDALRRQLDE
ncbi:MAG TPA: chaperone modulator CbpM [Acetobacteraceae bacterium]|jgi:chaperone modulatory protein CbpM